MLSTGLSARCSLAGTAVSVNRRQRPVSARASGAVRVDAKKGDIKKAMPATHSRTCWLLGRSDSWAPRSASCRRLGSGSTLLASSAQ